MSNHTPGPWVARQRDDDCWDVYSDDDGGIATLHDPIGVEPGMDHLEADANLIAAAPEMYEFIEFYAYAGRLQTTEDRERFREKAHALIAKARGES